MIQRTVRVVTDAYVFGERMDTFSTERGQYPDVEWSYDPATGLRLIRKLKLNDGREKRAVCFIPAANIRNYQEVEIFESSKPDLTQFNAGQQLTEWNQALLTQQRKPDGPPKHR